MVLAIWKKQGAESGVSQRLAYRFTIRDSVLELHRILIKSSGEESPFCIRSTQLGMGSLHHRL